MGWVPDSADLINASHQTGTKYSTLINCELFPNFGRSQTIWRSLKPQDEFTNNPWIYTVYICKKNQWLVQTSISLIYVVSMDDILLSGGAILWRQFGLTYYVSQYTYSFVFLCIVRVRAFVHPREPKDLIVVGCNTSYHHWGSLKLYKWEQTSLGNEQEWK